MSNVAVRVEGLGKLYRIGGKQERYHTLRDSLTDAVSAPFKRARSLLHGQAYGAAGLEETIWALKDVSFEVKHGEAVGIIGRNGAGKSTLLKILSRITEPTEGHADVYGRVGALLEVGTGFHQELTGRENIYLNGAILGMSRAEIDHKFDEIVDFAEVERFIDTPVKHYSSGMGLRLGFAVAAHLEPEILVVDEVLAVGDAQFQKKCLGKMSDVASEGRTVLFVSHNMAAIQNLCGQTILLKQGVVAGIGATQELLKMYLAEKEVKKSIPLKLRADREGTQNVYLTDIVVNGQPNPENVFVRTGDELQCMVSYRMIRNSGELVFHMGIYDLFGIQIIHLNSRLVGTQIDRTIVNGQVVCNIPRLPLPPGSYSMNLAATQDGVLSDRIENVFALEVEAGDFFNTGQMYNLGAGKCLVDHNWFQNIPANNCI